MTTKQGYVMWTVLVFLVIVNVVQDLRIAALQDQVQMLQWGFRP